MTKKEYIKEINNNSDLINTKLDLFSDNFLLQSQEDQSMNKVWYNFDNTYPALNKHKKEAMKNIFELFIQGKNMINYTVEEKYSGHVLNINDQYLITFSDNIKELTLVDLKNYDEIFKSYFEEDEYNKMDKKLKELKDKINFKILNNYININ